MGTQITIFAFIAAIIMFIVKSLASKADESGNIYIKTPKEKLKEIKNYIGHFREVRRRVHNEQNRGRS